MKFSKIIAILIFFFLFSNILHPYVVYHTVKKGENLSIIAKKYNKTPEEIKKMNNLKSSKIYPGQKLIVGMKEEKLKSEKSGEFVKDYYTVKKGDTLYEISKKFGIPVSEIKRMNNLKSSNLKIGQKLVLRVKRTEEVKKEINPDEIIPITEVTQKKYYKVCEGDTIESISEKFHIDPDKLLEANLMRRNELKPGQILIIPPQEVLDDMVKKETEIERQSSLRTKIIKEALSFLGTRYTYGGESKSGLDCSALTRLVYRKIGLELPQNSYLQYKNGIPVSKDDAKPGDLVFFNRGGSIGHVGIYLGEDLFIHASFSLRRVVISSLSERYFKNRFAGFRRYLSDTDSHFIASTSDISQSDSSLNFKEN